MQVYSRCFSYAFSIHIYFCSLVYTAPSLWTYSTVSTLRLLTSLLLTPPVLSLPPSRSSLFRVSFFLLVILESAGCPQKSPPFSQTEQSSFVDPHQSLARSYSPLPILSAIAPPATALSVPDIVSPHLHGAHIGGEILQYCFLACPGKAFAFAHCPSHVPPFHAPPAHERAIVTLQRCSFLLHTPQWCTIKKFENPVQALSNYFVAKSHCHVERLLTLITATGTFFSLWVPRPCTIRELPEFSELSAFLAKLLAVFGSRHKLLLLSQYFISPYSESLSSLTLLFCPTLSICALPFDAEDNVDRQRALLLTALRSVASLAACLAESAFTLARACVCTRLLPAQNLFTSAQRSLAGRV